MKSSSIILIAVTLIELTSTFCYGWGRGVGVGVGGATALSSQGGTRRTWNIFPSTTRTTSSRSGRPLFSVVHSEEEEENDTTFTSRRHLLLTGSFTPFISSLATLWLSSEVVQAETSTTTTEQDSSSLYAPKFVQQYSDFIETPSGWRYRDVQPGNEAAVAAKKGDRVVFDWSGYTIGYFGRPFQAKGGPMGGAFDKDLDFSRTILGSGTVIQGLEEALLDMKPGGIRQVVIPFEGNLSYPPDDLTHERVGPKPFTFSGQRALNFVLENPRLDRTLLFNVKVIRVDKADGKGGFVRG